MRTTRGPGAAVCRGRGARWQSRRDDAVGPGIAISENMLLTILLVLLILAALGGGFGYSRYGYGSWSPAGIIVVILIVMLLTGRL